MSDEGRIGDWASSGGAVMASDLSTPAPPPAPGGTTVTSGAPQITAPPPVDFTALLNALGLGTGTPPAGGSGIDLSGLTGPAQASGDTGGMSDGSTFPWGIVIIIAAVGIGIWWYVKRRR